MAKAEKPFLPVIATANHLRSGSVLYRTRSGLWSLDIAEAAVAETPESAAALLALAKADETRAELVDPNLIEVTRQSGALRPVSFRERIRASGPTFAFLEPDHVPV